MKYVPAWEQILVVLAAVIIIQQVLKEVFGVSMLGKKIYRGAPMLWKRFFRNASIDRAEMHVKLDKIVGEVTYNGGKSLKDVVRKINVESEIQIKLLKELKEDVDINSLRLDILDIGNDRMTFKLNGNGGCTFINESFLKTFGYTHRDIVGFNWENVIHEDDLKSVSEKWKRAIETKSRYYSQQRIKDIDGKVWNCIVIGYPVMPIDTLQGFYGTIDIIKEN